MAKIKMKYINKSLLGSKGCKPTVGFVLFLMILGCSGDNEYYIANKDKVRERPGQWVHFLVTEYENGIYKDTLHKTKIVPERSALVLIDVWRDEFLDQFVIDHINPLIEEFNTNGAKVIYAPSQMPENENLMVVDEGIHFYDFETMDSYLHENSILNLFYAGFDTFYCVLDKPNGVYNFKMRNKYSRTFLLERGVLSYTKEMMEASMELLKKNGVGVIPYSNGVKSFPQETITDINAKTKNSAPNSKENSFFIFYPSNDELESSILD